MSQTLLAVTVVRRGPSAIVQASISRHHQLSVIDSGLLQDIQEMFTESMLAAACCCSSAYPCFQQELLCKLAACEKHDHLDGLFAMWQQHRDCVLPPQP